MTAPAAGLRPVVPFGDAAATAALGPGDVRRSFTIGVRLGWAIQSNWSDPLLFVIYSVAKPLGAALILVAMVMVVSGGRAAGFLDFLIVGSAMWNFVGGALLGLVLAILEDRERYRMLKYVFVTPASLFPFLLGRSVASLVISIAGAIITLFVGVAFLGLRIDPTRIDWPLLGVSLAVGLVALAAIGIALAGLCLQLRQEAWSYPQAVAGSLYLLSGAIFPIDVLPGPLQVVATALPLTWWLEGVRRALLGAGAPGRLAGVDDATVVLTLLATTAVFTLASWLAYRFFERRAKERGLIDQATGS